MWESNQEVLFEVVCLKRTFFLCFVLVFEGEGKREKEIIYNYNKNKENTAFSAVSIIHGYEKKKIVSEKLQENYGLFRNPDFTLK